MTKREIALARAAETIKAEPPCDRLDRLTDCVSVGATNSDQLLMALGAKAPRAVKCTNPAWEAAHFQFLDPCPKEVNRWQMFP